MSRGEKVKLDGHVFRSKLEARIAQDLIDRGIPYEYEKEHYKYSTTITKGLCTDCAGTQVVQQRFYTPDFFLPNGVIVEAKGRFTAGNRVTLKKVRDSNPAIDLRVVLMANNRINRNSVTRYSDWCEQFGFQYAFGLIPEDWHNGC